MSQLVTYEKTNHYLVYCARIANAFIVDLVYSPRKCLHMHIYNAYASSSNSKSITQKSKWQSFKNEKKMYYQCLLLNVYLSISTGYYIRIHTYTYRLYAYICIRNLYIIYVSFVEDFCPETKKKMKKIDFHKVLLKLHYQEENGKIISCW